MNAHHGSLFIGGRWVAPTSGERITVLGASTEDMLGSVPHGGEKDMDVAVAAARAAFDDPDGWVAWEPARRANALYRLAEALERRVKDHAQVIAREEIFGPVLSVIPYTDEDDAVRIANDGLLIHGWFTPFSRRSFR